MNNNTSIILYTKLPKWFKIPTPLGSYNNPDWAILLNNNNEEKLYFVVETKGDISENQLRPSETNKIKCGKKHFESININFDKYDSIENFLDKNMDDK